MSKPDEEFDYFGDYMRKLRVGDVCDRFHYGAYVYGAMLCLHPVEGFSIQTLQMVSRFIHLRGGLIILMYDSDDKEYNRRLQEESKDEMFNTGDILLANQLFRNIDLIDKPDFLFDIAHGWWPTDEHAEMIVSQWRIQNGL